MGIRRIGKIQMPESPAPVEAVQKLASEQVLHPKQKYSEPEVTIADATEPRGYESPITLKSMQDACHRITDSLDLATENYIVEVVRQIGVDVDKERLFQALKNDRESYNKGYQHGLLDGYVATWKTLLVEQPAHGTEVLVALMGEGNDIFLATWNAANRTFAVKASNRVIPESEALEWCMVPHRVPLPF